jgi:hypothetical protein
MSIWGRIFGADEVIEKTIDTVGRVVDEAFYTKQEQAEKAAEARREGQQFMLTWLEATSPSRLARRVLAFMFTGVFLALMIVATGLSIAAVWLTSVADELNQSAALIDARLHLLENPITWILGFYFAPQLLEQAGKGFKSLFGGGK